MGSTAKVVVEVMRWVEVTSPNTVRRRPAVRPPEQPHNRFGTTRVTPKLRTFITMENGLDTKVHAMKPVSMSITPGSMATLMGVSDAATCGTSPAAAQVAFGSVATTSMWHRLMLAMLATGYGIGITS